MSWNSVAVQHATIDNRILFGVIPMSKVIPGLTLHQFYEVSVWSLKALGLGVFPSEDHNKRKFDEHYHPERAKLAGKPLAGVNGQIGYEGGWS